MQNKRILLVADHSANLQTAKCPAVAKRVDSFSTLVLPLPFAPTEVKAGR